MGGFPVVLAFEEPEETGLGVVVLFVEPVDVGRDAPHHRVAAPGQK